MRSPLSRNMPMLAAAAVLLATCPATAAEGAEVHARLDPHAPGVRVAPHFLGISLEYKGLPTLGAVPYPGVNRPLVGMLRNLSTPGQGAPVVRIGGGSADSAWFNPQRAPRPNGINTDLTEQAVQTLAQFHAASGAPLLPTLNFAANRPRYATDWARALLRGLGPRAFEAFVVGNEPDIYDRRPFGELPRTRPPGWSARRYARQMRRFIRELHRLHGHPRLAGPALCCRWDHVARRIDRRLHRAFDLFTFHAYPLASCPGAPASNVVTIPRLLADRPFFLAARRFALYRSQLGHRPVRVAETNSSPCGGRPGVSDTFAGALWLTDWLFLIAANDFEGVNLHASGSYAPFVFGFDRERGEFIGAARPEYYAMLLFARAMSHHARLVVSTTLGQRGTRDARARVWATATRGGSARFVIVNRDLDNPVTAVLRARGSHGSGRLERLESPTVQSNQGVTLGGMSVAFPTSDGMLTGEPAVERIARHGTAYRVRLAPTSAALLTVKTR